MKLKPWFFLLIAALVGAAAGFGGLWMLKPGYAFQGSLIEPPVAAQEFSLRDQYGQPFSLSEQRGKIVLLFFGYTHCPDICPATLAKYNQIVQRLGSQADQVRFVMITADPARDTADQLKAYLDRFNPDFIGLWGPEQILRVVYQNYWVFVEKEQDPANLSPEYLVTHSSQVFLIDPEGNLRLLYPPEIEAEAVAQDLAYLIRTSTR